jgi:membrane protease YdiL (CAAX protease family)
MLPEPGTGDGRGRRALLTVGILLVLLATVAVASTGETPFGEGGGRRPSDRLVDIVLSLFLVYMALGTVVILLLLTLRRDVLAEQIRKRRERRGRWAGLITVGLAFLLLALAVWLRNEPGASDGDLPGIATQPSATAADGDGSEPYDPEFAWVPVAVVLGVGVAGTAAVVVGYRRRRRHLEGEAQPVQIALADVIDETLDDLRREGDPRRAVIAAYARLERVLGAYGMPRRAAEAPDEYLHRVLADLEVGTHAVTRLTALFARAKFSLHDVDESMKEEALEALETARTELRAWELEQEAARAAALAEARERADR